MNMVDDPRDAVLTMTWEYIPSVPSGFDKVKPLWLDIGGCNGSSDQPAKANQAFQYTDPTPWKSNFTGRITWMGGHLHDGGVHLTVNKNNKLLCDCIATYGQNPAYVDGGSTTTMASSMAGMSMGTSTSMPQSTSTGMAGMNMGSDTVHISSISSCSNAGTIAIGDTLSVTAYYNSSKYSLMTNTDGSLAPIMGISIVYVADTNLTTTTVSSSSSGGTGTSAPSASASKSEGAWELGLSFADLFLGCVLVAGMLAVF
jgi:hypothetical protein